MRKAFPEVAPGSVPPWVLMGRTLQITLDAIVDLDKPEVIDWWPPQPPADIVFEAAPTAHILAVPHHGTRIGTIGSGRDAWDRCKAAKLDAKSVTLEPLLNGKGYLCARTAQQQTMVSFSKQSTGTPTVIEIRVYTPSQLRNNGK
ncbi:hypothetical protein AWW66_25130 [Micromonospora rosaria]|uniref:Uncharacterized protein n=1 Tax=Micromonospora rosaria TaxID=47874 RepID=A0A136PLM9_9ACTN|nr:hypothetical protein [Micromonospora rosaria]KXK59281.1 hypothetical protein AWW66_25130 [Micromonospora rosaria]